MPIAILNRRVETRGFSPRSDGSDKLAEPAREARKRLPCFVFADVKGGPMAVKAVAGRARRSRAKPTIAGEAGCAVETDRSVGAVLRRCAEARAMPVPEGPVMPPPPPIRRPRGSSAEQCGKRIQREMSRALEPICEMLLEETIQKRNLMALRVMLQMAVLYGVNRLPGKTGKAARADVGFARRMVEKFRERSAGAADGVEAEAGS